MIRIFLLIVLLSFHLTSNACQLGDILVDINFSNATSKDLLTSCKSNKDNEIISLKIKPENEPINNSPWFAFKLSSKQRKTVKIKLYIEGGSHRYTPKISQNGKQWQPIKYKEKSDYIQMKIELDKAPVWLAAQELITNQDYVNWGNQLHDKLGLEHDVIGNSVDKRPIYNIVSSNSNVEKWLVILGRQHPPEVTGALALFPFSTALLSDSELARIFRKHYNIVIVPNLNPDGVELGFWRHNKNGVDLNRDWKTFKQPEVLAVHNLLTNITKSGGKISMAVDFHSTHKDIFYSMPNDYGVKQPYLVNNWLGKLDKQYPNFSVIEKPGNNPDRGVFKQYIADNFKVHAITYEMGDNTDRLFIRKLAIDAANTLMQTMLKDNNEYEN